MATNIKNLGDGLKGINFDAWGGVDNFLRETSTGSGGTTKPQLLGRVNPWMAKARNMTAVAVSELPFDIMRGGDVLDTSSDWKNKLGAIPSPQKLMYSLASSLTLGRAYIIPQYTNRLITDLHYCAPHTVMPLITTNGLERFSRTSDFGQSGTYYPAGRDEIPEGYTGEMLYFWLSDSDVEIGPAKSYPASTALLSAELITTMDGTLQIISDRGFVPPTLIAAKGMTNPTEREKAEAWYNRFLRRWNETVAKIINAEAMDIKQIGAGMDELKTVYGELKKQAIEDIGTAYGIPAAIFMSDMAFATEVNPLLKIWYSTSEFMRIYQAIEYTFNTQLLYKFDCELKFHPEELDAFQEDETTRASAYREYVGTNMRPSIAAEMLGLDLPEGMEYSVLDEYYENSLERKTNEPEQPTEDNPVEVAEQPKPQKGIALDANEIKDLSTWADMAKRFFKKGKGAAVDFECKALPESIASQIRLKLASAKNELDVVKAFEIGEIEQKSDIVILAEAINNAANKLVA